MNLVVTFEYYDQQGRVFQCSDLPAIPRVGDEMSIWSSRDENGNYAADGKTEEIMKGKVVKVTYNISQQGNSSSTYRIAQYVTVYLDRIE